MSKVSQPNRIDCRTLSDGFERADVHFTGYAFSPHRHDTYGIGYTTRGVQAFDYRGETHRSTPGNVFVLHPDELHDGRSGTDGGFGYRIVYVSPDLLFQATDNAALPFVPQSVSANPALKSIIADVFQTPFEPHDDARETETICALADALHDVSDRPGTARSAVDRTCMNRIRTHLMASIVDGVSMPELEREHGIDRYSISRQFRRCFGVGPHRFVIMRRLDLARHHIRNGRSLADAANASGFADQSHMTRYFRSAFGITPGRWRALLV
jgi:AraC-like DNA-binding protein